MPRTIEEIETDIQQLTEQWSRGEIRFNEYQSRLIDLNAELTEARAAALGVKLRYVAGSEGQPPQEAEQPTEQPQPEAKPEGVVEQKPEVIEQPAPPQQQETPAYLRVGSQQHSQPIKFSHNPQREEALTWLKTNKNPFAFAPNRFGPTQNAIRFVEELYSLGAESVEVTNIFDEEWRIQKYGGPRADTLIVTVNPQSQGPVLEFLLQEARVDEVTVLGPYTYSLWWD